MSSDGSITRWISQLRSGDVELAQQELWNRYFQRLVGIARVRLRDTPKRMGDEEDAVVEAMNSFFKRMSEDRFPDLRDRTALWPLLVTITIRKASNLIRTEHAKKRSPMLELSRDSSGDDAWIIDVLDAGPTPDMVVMATEEAARLLSLLPRRELRRTAELKLQGFANREIAEREGVIERTVERRLESVRSMWDVAGGRDGA